MAIHFRSVHIDAFRGLRDMETEALNHVNLIVGDNNCGKTSFLEALQLLSAPADFVNVLGVSRQREGFSAFYRTPPYECFCDLFAQPSEEPYLKVTADRCGEPAYCMLRGAWEKVLLDEDDIREAYKWSMASRRRALPSETMAFVGEIEGGIGARREGAHVIYHEYSRSGKTSWRGSQMLDIEYLSPVDHVRSSLIARIVSNDPYKDICLKIVQIFDPKVTDLLILKNEQTGRPAEYIKHAELGTMPVSTYGDGIRRVLLLSNAIARTKNGVLLIDEIETAIHAQYYKEIFGFVIMACRQFDVQLFITTHSQEALDALLDAQNYDSGDSGDVVSVLTLKKTGERTLVRNLPGREVWHDRDAFDFEARL